jgi:RNA polymerase sigma-70 factor (ECF subfamily)
VCDTEQQWIATAKTGDKDAFAKLVEKYQKPVYSVCYRMLGTPTAAEDAAQEAFIRAYQALDRYDISRSFATWVLSIASNYSIDQLRKKKVTPSPSPEKAALEREKLEQIQSLLTDLNEVDRAAIILQYWHDYSYEEIADTLDLSSSAVKSRLFRARRLMAEKWQKMQLPSAPPVNSTAKRIAHETSTI